MADRDFDEELKTMRQLCKEGKLEELKVYFEKGISDEAIQTSHGQHLLRVACKKGQIEVCKFLLEDGRFDPMVYDNNNNNAIRSAMVNRQIEAFFLLESNEKVDLDALAPDGIPFFCLSCFSCFEIFDYFYSKGMDVTYKVPENNWSAIHIVCISDSPSIKILETLLKDERVDINLQDSKGRTPLALACKSSKLEPVKYLLNDPRIDITLVDSIGRSPFGMACKRNESVELVQYLLEDGRFSPIEGAGNREISPLLLANDASAGDIVVELLKDERIASTLTHEDAQAVFLRFLSRYDNFSFLSIERDKTYIEIGYHLWKIGFDLSSLVEGKNIKNIEQKIKDIGERVNNSTLGKSAMKQ